MPSEVPALTDSHAHLDSARYDADREAMLKAAHEAGVGTVLSIGIGDGPDTMHRALDLCREYAGRTDLPRLRRPPASMTPPSTS
jgi:TatD DNase family protein